MKPDKKLINHYLAIKHFKEKLYSGILSRENIISRKKAIKLGDDKFYGYFLEKDKELYFLEGSQIDSLPIRVISKEETDYKSDVFYFIKKAESVSIPARKEMTFREVIDTLSLFDHSNPIHWKLYTIIMAVSFCDRINYRVIAPFGFGKDSVLNVIKDLMGDTANIYGATFAKLEFFLSLNNLVFNELGNLKPEDKRNFQEFLLAVGAYSNSYTKRSRKTDDTREEYDISKTSIGILYNPISYYIDKGQPYFETMFTEAIISRFIPFMFDGHLSVPDLDVDAESIVTEYFDIYKKLISTMNYYKENPIDKPTKNYQLNEEITWSKNQFRYEHTFKVICRYIEEYSESESEYSMLVSELYRCYKKYLEELKQVKEV